MTLSPAQFRTIASELACWPTDSALRQIDLHQTAGDFDAYDCDRLRAAVRAHRSPLAS